jgi:hypothetical protein
VVRIEQIATNDFIPVQADDPVERVAELLAATRAVRVIVRRWPEGYAAPLYYVFPCADLRSKCQDKSGTDLQTLLGLRDEDATPLVDADASAETSPDVCVVHWGGEVIGLYDVALPPTWAKTFIDAGASAFLGTLWSVDDGAALRFASAFYLNLLGGRIVADAVWEARATAGITGLAYTVFADPFARVEPAGQPTP